MNKEVERLLIDARQLIQDARSASGETHAIDLLGAAIYKIHVAQATLGGDAE